MSIDVPLSAALTITDLNADTDERGAAVMVNAHFRLMLKLLSFEKTDDESGEFGQMNCPKTRADPPVSEQKWFIPASILPSNLSTSKGALEQYLADPPTLDSDPKTLIRRVRRRRPRAPDLDPDDSDPDRPRHPKPARRKKQAETQLYKSAAFIEDSDDDEEADRAFFEREKALREEMEELAKKHGGGTMREAGSKKRKRRGKGKDKNDDVEEEGAERRNGSALNSDDDPLSISAPNGRSPAPSTSPAPIRGRRSSERLPSRSPSLDTASSRESPIPTQARTNGRSKRIVHSDDSD